MIPHPAVETLLQAHGNTAEGRRAARVSLVAAIRNRAAMFAADAGRTDNCRLGRHHDRDHPGWGCGNSGATCICECHDPTEEREP